MTVWCDSCNDYHESVTVCPNYKVGPRLCDDCGSLPAFHAITCKYLPLRQDVMDSMREQLVKRSLMLEELKAEVATINNALQQMTDHRERCLEEIERTKLQLDEAMKAIRLIASCKSGFPGDVVDIAQKVVARYPAKPAAECAHDWQYERGAEARTGEMVTRDSFTVCQKCRLVKGR